MLPVSAKNIFLRLLLYVGLAIVGLAAFSLVFFISTVTHIVIPFRWVGLASFTGVLVFVIAKHSAKYRDRAAFWIICTVGLGIHVTAFVFLLNQFPDFRLVWYVPIVIGEAGVFGAACSFFLDRGRLPRKRHREEKAPS
ncbi:MAG TPA: hypothetical protein VG206_17595 [Terriglobia bacterium]|nr:hypothetical protein [Terriglobia bacterium]